MPDATTVGQLEAALEIGSAVMVGGMHQELLSLCGVEKQVLI